MKCERADYLEVEGIDTGVLCAGCSADVDHACYAHETLLAISSKMNVFKNIQGV